MTLPTSGTLSLDAIHTEFNLGRNLAAYRGVKWYKDDNSRGFFDNSATGNFPPIDFSEFYGTRKTITVTPQTLYPSTGSFLINFFYNTMTITVVGGRSGSRGSDGFNGCINAPTPGSAGGAGGTTSFGSWVSAGSDGSSTYVINADTTPNAPLIGSSISVNIGGGGAGGGGGPNAVSISGGCYPAGNASSGSAGAAGSVTVVIA
jgi:hypothetical protein